MYKYIYMERERERNIYIYTMVNLNMKDVRSLFMHPALDKYGNTLVTQIM